MGYFRVQRPAIPAAQCSPLLPGCQEDGGGPLVLPTHLCKTFSLVLCCYPVITAPGAVCGLAGGGDSPQAPQALAWWLLGGSCPDGRMLDPIHPTGILAVGLMPVAVPGLVAVLLPPMLMGRDGGAGKQAQGKAERTVQAMGVCKQHLSAKVARAPIRLQQPAGWGQAVNHAAAISWLITSLLLPRLRSPWGYAKKP